MTLKHCIFLRGPPFEDDKTPPDKNAPDAKTPAPAAGVAFFFQGVCFCFFFFLFPFLEVIGTIFVGHQRLVVLVFALFERFGSVIGFDNTVFA